MVVALSPIVHPHNRTLLSLGLDLSLIIEPHEHLGKVSGDDSDVGGMPDIDGRRSPRSEANRAGAFAVEDIDSARSIVKPYMLVDEDKVGVEQCPVEVCLDKLV